MEIQVPVGSPVQSPVASKQDRAQDLGERRRAADSAQERGEAERSGETRDSSGEASVSIAERHDRAPPPERRDNDVAAIKANPGGGLGRAVDIHA